MTLVIPLLATLKGAVRTIAVIELLPEWKSEVERVGLGLDGSRALCFVSVYVEFYRFARDQTHSLARNPLRIDLAEHHALLKR